MKLGNIEKREILKKTAVVLTLISVGWFLKSRLTPPSMGQMGAAGEPYVITQTITSTDISNFKSYVGIVEPINAVDLRPQITGAVEKTLFQEGSFVNTGDILFVIDQSRYLANVNLREAELKKAQANLTKVEKDYNRQVSLKRQNFASQAQLDNVYSDYLQSQAMVKQAQANLDLAKIDFNHTEIKAPISGYIGKALVTEGNYVSSPTEVLARIVQTDPIRIEFSMSDGDFLDTRTKFQEANGSFRARIKLPNGQILENKLQRRFIDNEVNKSTATVAVFAEFENADNMLIPGNYVNILIGYEGGKKAILIPHSAISQDENGAYAMVVNSDNIAEQKRIVLGDSINNRQVILEGLNEGDFVIIQGLQKVKNGQKVKSEIVK